MPPHGGVHEVWLALMVVLIFVMLVLGASK